MLSLAPKRRSNFSPVSKKKAVSTTEIASRTVKQLPRIRSAASLSPCPILIEAWGAPPIPMRALNAEIIMIIGKETPTPVSAAAPTSGMCPMYIRSTMLYSILTSCAAIAGSANRNSSFPIRSFPKSLGLCFPICFHPFSAHCNGGVQREIKTGSTRFPCTDCR